MRIIQENATLPARDRINPNLLLILDDCITQREASHSRALEQIFVLGRHLCVSVIMTTQHAAAQNAVPPIIRVNTDFVWVAAQSSQAAVDLVTDTWMSGVTDKRSAELVLHSVTRSAPYTFLVIDARRAATSMMHNECVCVAGAGGGGGPWRVAQSLREHRCPETKPTMGLQRKKVWAHEGCCACCAFGHHQ
jgi:hypothetical protein